MSAIQKLRGRKILISLPVIEGPKSNLVLTPEIEQQQEREFMKKWTSLEVFAVGELVEDIKVGDKVYISSGALSTAERIEIGEEVKFMIDDYNVNIIW